MEKKLSHLNLGNTEKSLLTEDSAQEQFKTRANDLIYDKNPTVNDSLRKISVVYSSLMKLYSEGQKLPDSLYKADKQEIDSNSQTIDDEFSKCYDLYETLSQFTDEEITRLYKYVMIKEGLIDKEIINTNYVLDQLKDKTTTTTADKTKNGFTM